jgi:secreted PhoX family phosphatase
MSSPTSPFSPAVSRRTVLRYVGAGAAALGTRELLGPLGRVASAAPAAAAAGPLEWVSPDGTPLFTPVDYPLPQPGDGGNASADAERFARFDVADDLVLPAGFRYDLVAAWGDRFGPASQPDKQVVFGFAADYTGLVPVAGAGDEFFLIVNHEYISGIPWVQGREALFGERFYEDGHVTSVRALCEAALDDLGVSVLRVRRLPDGRFAVVRASDEHFRIGGFRATNTRGAAMRFTGPAAPILAAEPRGTFSNCSGGTTPWGTFLSCEENFQDQVPEFIRPDGRPILDEGTTAFAAASPHPVLQLPFEFEGLGTGLADPLDGRQYGWVVEIDPVKRTLVKHTTMGRFRHENVALRVEAGKPLAAYLGDDRRGGHVWKFVSRDAVQDPTDPANSRLFEHGTLYAARFDANEQFDGAWIALTPQTPLVRPAPETCATGHLWLPRRPGGGHVAVGVAGGKNTQMTVAEWIGSIEEFTGKSFADCTLGDLVTPPRDLPADQHDAWKLGVILMDAYVLANAAGATPSSRPEDVEVHPLDRSVYIAFTDSTGSGDGSPDVRVFPDSGGTNSRQYGAIYHLRERDDDPAATRFNWGRFVAAGELADGGGGFACADNLAFDPQGNLWMVTDITTPAHNFTVDRQARTAPGAREFVGVFGNNALFCIPTAGANAGVPFCFAIGPSECELTGPTFTDDGRTLILAVQHPGENHGARGRHPRMSPTTTRTMTLAARDGRLFTQQRTVPLGSNFPSGKPGDIPRPCVVCITRAT